MKREAQLRLREQALELQLHSDKFFGNHAPVPNTPHADTVLSRFSEKYTVACKWTVDDVIAWVSVLPDGLSKYTAIFREHEISGDVLINLTDEALEQKLNIKPYGHRYVFYSAYFVAVLYIFNLFISMIWLRNNSKAVRLLIYTFGCMFVHMLFYRLLYQISIVF